jgi:very-short-patch-repair endonuclease
MKRPTPLPDGLRSRPFSATEALDAGVSRGRLRVGDLAHPFRGVYLPGAAKADVAVRCHALAHRLPEYAFFSSITAASLYGVPLPLRHENSDVLHVGVPAPFEPPSGRGISGHMLEMDGRDIQLREGLRLPSPEETWCQLASYLLLNELVAAGDFLIHWRSPMSTIELLTGAVLGWHGRRGVLKLRRALDHLNERSESPQESALRVIVTEAGFAGLEANYWIQTSGGYRYRADLAFPARRLILEYQSAFHENPESFRSDMTRVSRLEADDWKVTQINKDDLRDRVELVSRIARILKSRPHF